MSKKEVSNIFIVNILFLLIFGALTICSILSFVIYFLFSTFGQLFGWILSGLVFWSVFLLSAFISDKIG